MADEEGLSGATTKTPSLSLPWNHASSLWQSSFSCPLANTSLRAYLSKRNVKELKASLPVKGEMQQQYFNEAIKFSYVAGLYDSAEIHGLLGNKKRSGLPGQSVDNVREVMQDNDSLPDSSRLSRKKMVPGFRCTNSSVGHSILEHPEDAELPVKTASASGRCKVSGKIGSRPRRKGGVDSLPEHCWAPTDLNAIPAQGDDDTGPMKVCNSQRHAHPPKHELHDSSRPLPRKKGRSMQSGIVLLSGVPPPRREAIGGNGPSPHKPPGNPSLSGISGLTLAPYLEPVIKNTAPIAAQAELAPAEVTSRYAKPTAARLQALQQLSAPHVKPKVEPTAERSTAHRGVSQSLMKKAVRDAYSMLGKAEEAGERCRLMRVAYMPLFSVKPRLMDLTEKSLFGGIKALTAGNRSMATDRTATP